MSVNLGCGLDSDSWISGMVRDFSLIRLYALGLGQMVDFDM
jgi:hypothetical protein